MDRSTEMFIFSCLQQILENQRLLLTEPVGVEVASAVGQTMKLCEEITRRKRMLFDAAIHEGDF